MTPIGRGVCRAPLGEICCEYITPDNVVSKATRGREEARRLKTFGATPTSDRLFEVQPQLRPLAPAHRSTTSKGGAFQNTSNRYPVIASTKSPADKIPLTQTG